MQDVRQGRHSSNSLRKLFQARSRHEGVQSPTCGPWRQEVFHLREERSLVQRLSRPRLSSKSYGQCSGRRGGGDRALPRPRGERPWSETREQRRRAAAFRDATDPGTAPPTRELAERGDELQLAATWRLAKGDEAFLAHERCQVVGQRTPEMCGWSLLRSLVHYYAYHKPFGSPSGSMRSSLASLSLQKSASGIRTGGGSGW